jgi:hypothetical protein
VDIGHNWSSTIVPHFRSGAMVISHPRAFHYAGAFQGSNALAVEDNASPFTMLTCEPRPDVAPILPAKAESSGILEVEKVERAFGKQAR